MDDASTPGRADQEIPAAWRPTLSEVVRALVEGDHGMTRSIKGVQQPSADTAARVRRNIAAYGETLVELPEAAWETSCAQRVSDHRWIVLVDLWTAESGRSDMVLDVWVETTPEGPTFQIHLVYVP